MRPVDSSATQPPLPFSATPARAKPISLVSQDPKAADPQIISRKRWANFAKVMSLALIIGALIATTVLSGGVALAVGIPLGALALATGGVGVWAGR